MLEQVNPREFAKIFNKRNIEIFSSNRSGGRAQTSEKTNSKGALEALTYFGNGSCRLLAC
jgi:hypothetical protein